MAPPGHVDLEASMLEWVHRHCQQGTENAHEVDSQTNLMEKGILDSVAFLDLIVFIEERTGQQIDLLEIDPNDLASIVGLCRQIEKQKARKE